MEQLKNFAYTGNTVAEDVTTSTAVTRTVLDADGNQVATLKAEPFGGVARINYESVLRTMYADGRTLVGSCTNCYRDNAIACHATIGGTDYVFARGVAQYGETASMIRYKFRVTLPRLRQYNGYEFGVVFGTIKPETTPIVLSSEWSLQINGGEIDSDELDDAEIVFADLSAFNGGTLRLYGAERFGTRPLLDSVNITKHDAPAHPFYVRWLNDRGGYDYYMFACNQKHTRQMTTNTYYEKDGARGVQTSLDKIGASVVEVSSGMVDAETFQALARMPYSPDIRWYNESIGAFVPVQMNEANTEWLTEQPSGEFICSFVLPTPQNNK